MHQQLNSGRMGSRARWLDRSHRYESLCAIFSILTKFVMFHWQVRPTRCHTPNRCLFMRKKTNLRVFLQKEHATRPAFTMQSLPVGPMPCCHAWSALRPYTNEICTVFARPSQVFAPLQCMPQVLALKWSFTTSSSTTGVIDSYLCTTSVLVYRPLLYFVSNFDHKFN